MVVQNKWLKKFQNKQRLTLAEIISGQPETFPTIQQVSDWGNNLIGNADVMVTINNEMQNALTWLIYNTFYFSIPYYNNKINIGIHIAGFIQRWWLNLYKWWELQVQINSIINMMNEGKSNTETVGTTVGRKTDYDNNLLSQGYDANSFNPVSQSLEVTINQVNAQENNTIPLTNLANMTVNSNDTFNKGKSNTTENIGTTRTFFNMDMLNKIQTEAQTLINPFIKKCAELFEFIDIDDTETRGYWGFNIW